MRCPDGAALAAWVDGESGGASADHIGAHVEGCARCQRAARAERQVKRRASLLRADLAGPMPDADLLSMLLTVPQAEHDRALRRAHRASCGGGYGDRSGSRLRVAVVGAGAAVWLAAAIWSAPTAPAPSAPGPTTAGVVTPTSSAPAGVVQVAPVGRWVGARQPTADAAAGR